MSDDLYGFECVWSQEVKELQGRVALYRYGKNGAEVLSVENEDENKVFGVCFRTPPRDSTGVAHILEHSVLNGSRKYPVKEPFVELLKGSVQSFLNALTFPDRTCYPVASHNLTDFYNLIDVYLDSVFHPLLTRDTFDQEGWHLEVAEPDAAPELKGVVYNEMKGAYSSPDDLLQERSQQSLFPDSPYGLESGGHPQVIPELTYEAFLDFHRRFYHPSNARFFFYGDDDPQERLRFLEGHLREYDKLDVDSEVDLQSRFTQPVRETVAYPAEASQDPKCMITLNWLLESVTQAETNLALQILEQLLIGMPSSPLRKELIESGLGEDLAGVGLENELRQMFFSTGLKGVRQKDLPRVEELIQDTLQRLSREGFDASSVDAAMNSVEFALRENNTGSMPRGLMVLFRSLATWIYDSDPSLLLCFETPLTRIKERIQAGEPVFEQLMQRYFLDNPHRSTVFLQPDREEGERIRQREGETIDRLLEGLSAEEREALHSRSLELLRKQQTPDDPEDLARIPCLGVSDLPREEPEIPCEEIPDSNGTILYHELSCNRIVYVDLCFDMGAVPQKLLSYVPLLGRALTEMGTDAEDYVALDRRIEAETGGIEAETFFSGLENQEGVCAKFLLRGKAMQDRSRNLLSLMEDCLNRVWLEDKNRFLQILQEEKAQVEEALIPAGHRFVDRRLRARFHLADWVREHTGGVSYLLFLRYLLDKVHSDWEAVREDLRLTWAALLNSRGVVANLTAEDAGRKQMEPGLREFLAGLPADGPAEQAWRAQCERGAEGMALPAQVNYVGKALGLLDAGFVFHGSHQVINRYLRTTWLWDKIRVQGGAYGAFSLLDRFSGILSFVSYRDPQLTETLSVFDNTARFLREADINDSELNKAIVGAVGDLDRPRLPDAKGMLSLVRYLVGDDHAKRQRIREEILATDKRDFRNFAEWLDSLRERGEVAVLGDQLALDGARNEGVPFSHTWQVL
ncbi:MAG: insulinase family protein [Desulfohalobiaceae bacterium]|nr:insulinase family protein [Desulfohalobiaceae bacterium]